MFVPRDGCYLSSSRIYEVTTKERGLECLLSVGFPLRVHGLISVPPSVAHETGTRFFISRPKTKTTVRKRDHDFLFMQTVYAKSTNPTSTSICDTSARRSVETLLVVRSQK